MGSIFKSIVGACTVFSAMATAVPAQARHDGYRDYREYRWNDGRHRYRDYDRPRYRDYRRYGYRDYGRYRYYPRGYYYRDYPRGYYRDDSGAILVAGIIGLALGAAIASDRDRDHDDHYYRDYYDD